MTSITLTEPTRKITYDDYHRITNIDFLDAQKSVSIDYAVGPVYAAVIQWSDGYVVRKKNDGSLEWNL